METLYQLGLELTTALQSFSVLDAPMRFFSFLGTKEFFIFVLPVIYWCVDARLGIRVALILLIGTAFNEILKVALQGPRPYWVSADVKALSAEATFGIPSGHSQTAAGLWGMLAVMLRKPWVTLCALVLIVLIGVSRIYLGVHFPQDVLVGWLLGALTLWAFVVLWEPAARWLRRRSTSQLVLICLVAPALILLPAVPLVNALGSYELPADWMANAQRAGEPYPAPVGLDSTLTAAGALCGFSLGLVVIQRAGGFSPAGPAWKRAICFLVGLVGIAVLYVGLKAILPEGESLLGGIMRFVRYASLGFWAGAGAPWVFRRLGLNPQPVRT